MKRIVAKKALSLLLSVCMIFSVLSTTFMVTAEESTEPLEINYVSLGDSMSNGYGLPGYNSNSGVADYGNGSYANLFAEKLKSFYGADVNHAQLSMSGIRTEDIHWLLEFDYNDPAAIALVEKAVANKDTWENVAAEWNEFFGCGDFWTVAEIVNHSRIDATYYAIAGGTHEGVTYESILPADYEYPETYDKSADMSYGKNRVMKIALIAKYYQECVDAADIISLSVGNGNLGVFGFGRILEVVGFKDSNTYLNYNYEDVLRECDEELQAYVIELVEELKPTLAEYVPEAALVDVALYIAVSLVVNYAGTLDAILQMNPDVEIVLVPVMNTFGDDFATVEGQITIGDLLDLVIEPLNKYIAGLPAIMQVANNGVYKNAKFYWAELDKAIQCMVDVYETEIYTSDTVRDRFVESIVGDDSEAGMIWGLLDDMVVPVTLEEIKAYEALGDSGKLAYAADPETAPKAPSIAMYLAFEKAIIAGKDNPVTLESVLGLAGIMASNPFGPIMADFAAAVPAASDPVVGDVAAFVATNLGGGVVTTDQLVRIVTGTSTIDEVAAEIAKSKLSEVGGAQSQLDAYHGGSIDKCIEDHANGFTHSGHEVCTADIIPTYNSAVATAKTSLETAVEAINGFCMLLVMPETLSEVVAESELSGLLALFARCIIGNGLGAHPSAAGHETLFEAVWEAYSEENTALDETIENLEYILSLIEEYYDEAYAYGYEHADENGYVDMAADAIDEAIAAVEAAIIVVEEAEDEFGYEYPHLIGELKAMIETLEELQAALYNDNMATVPELIETIYALEDNLNHHLYHIYGMLDTLDAAVRAQIEIALEELEIYVEEELIPALEELANVIKEQAEILIAEALAELEELCYELIDAIVEAVKEYAPEVADAIYDYLYNNPEEVIAFFEEYGDDILALLEEYGDEALAVIGFILYTYGEDIAAVIIENHEEIIGALVWFVEVHGENTWALVMVYADALGITDLVEETLDTIENELNAQKELLEEKLAELKAELEALKAELEAASEELKAEIEAAIAEIEAAIADIKANLAELDEAIKAELADFAEELAQLLADALVEFYPQIIDALVEAAKKFAPEIADAIYDYLYNNPEEVIAFFEEYGDEILALFEEYGDEALAVIGFILYTYGEDIAALIIENHEEILEALIWFAEEHGENTLALIKVYADALGITECIENTLEEIEAELNEKLEKLEAELEALKAELEALLEELEAASEELKAEIEAAIAEIEAAIAEIEAAIAAIKAELAEIAAELEAIVNALKDVEDAILDLIEAIESGSKEFIEAAIEDLIAALETLKEVTEAADALIDAIIAGLEAIGEIADALDAAFAELEEALAELKAELKDALAELEAAIKEQIEAALAELDAIIKAQLEILNAELMDLVNNEIIPQLEALKAELEATVDEYLTLAETYYELAKFTIELMYYMATNPTYVRDEDSLYIAFGDSSAASTSYVELLAAFIGVPYSNVSYAGLSYSTLLEGLTELDPEPLAVIAGADLITLGFSPSFGIVEALNDFIAEEENDYASAWTELLGEEAAYVIGEYFAALEEDLADLNIYEMTGIDNAEGPLVSAIQGYVYGVISDMVAMPQVVSLLREISPNATIIVLNMYNPLKDVVIDLGSVQLPLGDVTNAVIAAAGIEGLAYAMLTQKCNFVNITDVEIGLEDTTLDLFDIITEFVMNGGTALNPTVKGHFEIVEQIFDKMNLIFDYPLGDVDMDWDVDHVDAMLTLQYYSGIITEDALNVDLADVNGDGEINHVDAMLILQLYSGVITEFPYVEPDIDIEFDSDEELAA